MHKSSRNGVFLFFLHFDTPCVKIEPEELLKIIDNGRKYFFLLWPEKAFYTPHNQLYLFVRNSLCSDIELNFVKDQHLCSIEILLSKKYLYS